MSTGSLERIDGSLGRCLSVVRRRTLLVRGFTIVGWAAIVAVLLWLTFAWLDLLWELSPEVRVGLGAIAFLSAVAAIAAGLLIAIIRTQKRAVARSLDRAGDTGGQILSGYDLWRPPPHYASPSELSQGLADLAVERAGVLAERVPMRQAVHLRPLARMGVSVLMVSAAIVGLVVLLPGLAENQWLRFFDPYGDHPPFSRITFSVEPGNARVLYGSGLDVYATTEGPAVDRVELVVRSRSSAGDEVLPMFREPAGRWRTVLSRVTSDAQYHVRSGRSRSRRFDLDVITIPRLAGVRFRITPPEYSRRPAYEGPLSLGGLAGLAGTKVELWAKSNRPLSRGIMTIVAGDQRTDVPLKPVAAASPEVGGSFDITSAGTFELGVTDVAGHDSSDKLAGSIVLLADERPFVRITQPPATALATPSATLPVSVAGEDDYGISRVQLFRSLNESRALPLDFDVPQPSPTRYDAQQNLPLSAYGLSPGDVIKLFARIEDNDPAGAKGAESPMVTVRIISQSDYEAMLRKREGLEVLVSKYRQAQRRLESLAEEHRGLRKRLKELEGRQLDASARESIKGLSQRLGKESKQVRDSLQHLLPYDLDRNLANQLEQLAQSLEEDASALEDLADREQLDAQEVAKHLDQLLDKLASKKKDFEKGAMEPLEHLEQIYPLIEDQARFLVLYQQQRDLAERLSSLKGRDHEDDPRLKARMRSLEEEQRRLRQSLSDLLDDIEHHAARLPEDERLDELRATALKFADDVRASEASGAMTDAETALAGFSGTEGHAGALKAADILERFIQKCQGTAEMGQLCLRFQPGLSEGLGSTVEQLLAELGLLPGQDGTGSSGYSTRRSTLQNVGLFGQFPGMDQMLGRTGNRNGPDRGAREARDSSADNTSGITSDDKLRATGPAAAAVPPRYRSRVGAYFQRIAEESQSR